MITPDAIVDRAKRVYPKVVQAWLAGNLAEFFPYRIPANLSLAKNHATAIAEVQRLRQSSKQTRGHGYSVEYASRRSRTYGLNQFPIAIWIETLDDLLQLTDTSQEWETLQRAVTTLRTRQPKLGPWVSRQANWRKLLEVADVLDGLLDIVDFFQTHPRPDCFAREMPISVSTKLLEAHRRRLAGWLDLVLPPDAIDHRYGYDAFEPRYGLRYARPHFLLRVLDTNFQAALGLAFNELSLPAESISQLPVADARVLVVENKINLLALPAMERTIALGGLGNGVTQLSDIAWLHENPVYYWGDLDAEGFVILDRLRQWAPHVKSILMNPSALDEFQRLATSGNGSEPQELENLTSNERECYVTICQTNRRIEQEHIGTEALLRAIQEMEQPQPNQQARHVFPS